MLSLPFVLQEFISSKAYISCSLTSDWKRRNVKTFQTRHNVDNLTEGKTCLQLTMPHLLYYFSGSQTCNSLT